MMNSFFFSLSCLLVSRIQADDFGDCSIYLAESSIKDAGWGVFAGKDYAFGDRIGEPGLGIPILEANKVHDRGALRDFIKHSETIGGTTESSNVYAFLPGVQSLANFHSSLANAFEGGLTMSPTDRHNDRMAGSYTNYHGFTPIATSTIQRGQEIFLDAPPGWFSDDAKLPERKDYEEAQKIVSSLLDYHSKFPDLSEVHWIDILHRLKTEIVPNLIVSKALPSTIEELLLMGSSSVERAALTSRDFEWVKQHGYCLDNIREGPSTIAGAGRGAFATRRLNQDTVITPAPLVQIMDRSEFNFGTARANATSQLLLNYCFGHRKSALLLCPTTHVTLINHNSKSPNAKIRWSKASHNRWDGDINFRTRGLDELFVNFDSVGTFNTKIAFEVVATKDIEVGEEIFLDYGPEWENAFLDHNRLWSPPSDPGYIPPSQLNQMDNSITLSKDLPFYYQYECPIEPGLVDSETSDEVGLDYDDYPHVWPDRWNEHDFKRYGENTFIFWYPCSVFAVNDDGTFQADVFSKRRSVATKIRKWKNIPREAIRFADAWFQSDQHLPSAFRHYIPIPDNMFPLRWRSDYTNAESVRLGRKALEVDLPLSETEARNIQHENKVRNATCGLYFAPSNIPNAGFGMYAGIPLAGKGIAIGTHIPVIPVSESFPRPWNGGDYVWRGSTYYAEYESAETEERFSVTDVLAVDSGALANSHLGLVNEDLAPPRFDPVLDRCHDPGAGAFSDYVHHTFTSRHALGAGEELFVSYGDAWFQDRDDFASVPLTSDWMEANAMLASVWSTSQLDGAKLDEKQTIALLNVIKQTIVRTRTRSALDTIQSFSDLQLAIERNGTAEATMEVRSPEWFEEHGQCLDHVYVERSTIPQAGFGGFARRFLKKGSVVISAPLMTTFGDDMMRFNISKENRQHLGTEINDHQLLLNYQFSHPNSSVYFFPITHAFMFNHNSPRVPEGQEPNAHLRWAIWNKKSSYFLQRPLEDLEKEHYSVIVIDVIATRDILVDEEIFIDYGVEWELAWQNHVAAWESPCIGTNGVSSLMVKQMNDAKFDTAHHKWSDDHFTVCRKNSGEQVEWIHLIQEGDVVPVNTHETIMTSFHEIEFDHKGFDYSRKKSDRLPCVIIGSDAEEWTFDVAYFDTSLTSRIPELHSARVLQIRRGLPASELEFINRPFRSDMHWKGAFRHAIKIPDEIFPLQWRDLA